MSKLFSVCALSALMIGATNEAEAQDAEAKIRVGRCSVFSTKANGRAWDSFGGKPDLMVFVSKKEVFGRDIRTTTKRNTYSADFNEVTATVSVGDAVRISVFDDDASNDDIIGRVDLVISQEFFNAGYLEIGQFGRVSKLVLKLDR